jgi:hypothetical protein
MRLKRVMMSPAFLRRISRHSQLSFSNFLKRAPLGPPRTSAKAGVKTKGAFSRLMPCERGREES